MQGREGAEVFRKFLLELEGDYLPALPEAP